jgi:cation transport protein ChaC
MGHKLLDASFDHAAEDLWVFGYGSLIWKQGFEFDEAVSCTVHGWHRRFCLGMWDWRGTPDNPGLILALDRGGSCAGVAFRLPDGDLPARMRQLIDRELDYEKDVGWIRWLTARAEGTTFRALTFYCTPNGFDPELVRVPEAQQWPCLRGPWVRRGAAPSTC